MNAIIELLMVVAPVIGYVDQLRVMQHTRTSEGFSRNTPGILLVASILRIFFWIGRRFDNVLLYQSILMIFVQIVVVESCVRHGKSQLVSPSNPFSPTRSSSFPSYLNKFWAWPAFTPYLLFLAGLSLFMGLLQIMFGSFDAYVEIVGALALGIEAAVPLPQALENNRLESVKGFSPIILLTWVGGDAFKTAYFVSTGAPAQFVLCGIVQLIVDAVIVYQCFMYSNTLRRTLGLNARGPPSLNRSRYTQQHEEEL